MSDHLPEDQNKEDDEKKYMPFFPDYILDEAIAWYIVLALLVALASLLPAGLEEQATPLNTPAHVKPEWYFLFFYQFLKIVPRTFGVLSLGGAIVVLFLIPFIDRSSSRKPRARRAFLVGGVLALIGIIFLTIWGHYS